VRVVHRECDRARQWLSGALDGELSDFEGVLLEGHLSACAACRGYRADLNRMTEALRAAPLEPFTASMEFRRLRRARFRLAPAVAALAVAAVGLGSILTASQVRTASPSDGFRLNAGSTGPALASVSGLAPLGEARVRGAEAVNARAGQVEPLGQLVTAARTAAPLRGGPVLDKK
jgi:predicted anti-sigma-YlaC factor YlaD